MILKKEKEAAELVSKALMSLDPKVSDYCGNENAAGVLDKRNC